MKKIVYCAFIVPAIMVVSCKTTHPAGIYEKAQAKTEQPASSVISAPATQAQVPAATPVATKENVRKEAFKPIETETNQDVVNKKYHAQKPELWNGKQCAVVLTYDDAIDIDLDNVVPALDSVALKGTFYLIGQSPVVANRMIRPKSKPTFSAKTPYLSP